MSRLFFRKSQRISSEKDFARVLSHRCVVRRGAMRLYAAPNELTIPRFAVSVSKTCGSAVARNRLKRLIREVFRLNQEKIRPGYDYILIVSQKKQKHNVSRESLKKPVQTTYPKLETAILEMIDGAIRSQAGNGDTKERTK